MNVRELLPRKTMHQVSVLELLLVTATVIALVISHQARSATAFTYSASFAGGLMGARIGMASLLRRTVFVAVAGIVHGAVLGMAAGWYFGLSYGRWAWLLDHDVPRITPAAVGFWQPTFTFLPRAAVTGLVAAALYSALCYLQSRLRSADS